MDIKANKKLISVEMSLNTNEISLLRQVISYARQNIYSKCPWDVCRELSSFADELDRRLSNKEVIEI